MRILHSTSQPFRIKVAVVTPQIRQPHFHSTRWSTVLEAGGVDSPEARAALEKLCRLYWFPLYAHVRRRGFGPEDSADRTQEFFATLLRRGSLSGVRPENGRFRTFLLVSFDYFLQDQSHREQALKRGGGITFVQLDALTAEQRYALEPASEESPDKAFDRCWAAAMLDQAFARLQEEQEQAGRSGLFSRLRTFLAREVQSGEYEAAGADLDMTPNTVAKTVQRLRLRVRELLVEEAARTVTAPGDAEQELRALFG